MIDNTEKQAAAVDRGEEAKNKQANGEEAKGFRLPDSNDELQSSLDAVLAGLSREDQVTVRRNVNEIATRLAHTGITVKELRSRMRELSSQHVDRLEELWRRGEQAILTPAQHFDDGRVYTCIYLGDGKPYLLCSDRSLISLDEKQVSKLGFRLGPKAIPAASAWSVSPDTRYSAWEFVYKDPKACIHQIYLDVKRQFDSYVDFADQRYFSFLALWTMGTYFHQAFDSYPMVYLNGTKRCGKTRTMEVVSELAFNARMSASITPAALYRVIERDRPTLLLDEQEDIKGKTGWNARYLELLNSGYLKSGRAMVCVGDDFEPTEFSTYCPKMIANINGIEKTLADRTIPLHLMRSDKELKVWRLAEAREAMHDIRNQMYTMMLQHHKKVAEIYRRSEEDKGIAEKLRHRELQLWDPIVTMAILIDEAAAEAGVEGWTGIRDEIIDLAVDIGDRKNSKENDELVENLIIQTVIEFINSNRPIEGDFHRADALLNEVRKRDGLCWITSHQKLLSELERIGIIKDRRTDRARKRLGTGTYPVTVYRMNLEEVECIARRHGVEVE
jgi:hypothetical protein